MPHHRDGFYQQKGSKLEVWFCVKGRTEYAPPDRTISLRGFYSDHVRTAKQMIDESLKPKENRRDE